MAGLLFHAKAWCKLISTPLFGSGLRVPGGDLLEVVGGRRKIHGSGDSCQSFCLAGRAVLCPVGVRETYFPKRDV